LKYIGNKVTLGYLQCLGNGQCKNENIYSPLGSNEILQSVPSVPPTIPH